MKKICFVTIGNLYSTPYIDIYLNTIKSKNNCDIIYWDRNGIIEQSPVGTVYRFLYKLSPDANPVAKIYGYIEFRKYASNILRKHNYDAVVILQTLSGLLLSDVLRKVYKNKYILDIRDYSFEKLKPIYWMEKRLVDSSALVVISSKGYEVFLPKHDYVAVHNSRLLNDIAIRSIRQRKNRKSRLTLTFVGTVNYQEQCKKLIALLCNDARYELHFIGARAEELAPYVEGCGANNVRLIGRFDPEDILKYYAEADVINNLYGNHTPRLDYALSNKLYFAAELHMPILVCPDTYIAKVSTENNFGFVFDMNDETAPNRLWEWYQALDWNKLRSGCDSFMMSVEADNDRFRSHVNAVLN